MKINKIFVVYRKEIKDTLRDRRTLLMMILVPILLYPLLFSVIGQIMALGSQKLESEKSIVAFIPEIPQRLDSLLQANPNLEILVSPTPAADLKSRQIQAYLEAKHVESQDSLLVYFDAAVDRSRQAKQRLEVVLKAYRREIQEAQLARQQVDLAVLEPFALRSINTAPPARMGGMLMGAIIPLLLIVTLLLGAMYPAIDLTAGEKERGTLETILTVPVSRLELLLGKYLTVATIAFITGMLNLISMALAYTMGFIQMGNLAGKLEFTFSLPVVAVLILIIIPLALFMSAAILSICIFARSFKDAQNLVTPLYLVLMFPALFAATPGIELTSFMALIPILNASLLFKEIMLNNFAGDLIFSVFFSNVIFAFLTLLIFSKLFNAEEILFSGGKGWQFSFKRKEIIPANYFQPGSVLLIFAFVMLLLFYAGSLLQINYRQWGILGTEWILIFLPVVLAIWYNKVNLKKSLHLKGFSLLALLGTLFLTFGGLVLTTWFARIQISIFPEAAKIGEILEKFLNLENTNINPLTGFFIFAISPAICEELLFRGVILSSLKKHLSPVMTISIVALLFGLFHIQIFRILPAAIIGLYLTFIVYYTNSIYLSILAHALNNGLAFALITWPGFGAYFSWLSGEEPLPLSILFGALFLVIAGIILIKKSSRSVKEVLQTTS